MTINPSIFKAYDIRGTYPDEVNEEVAFRVGRAFVDFTGSKVVIVGRDARTSSDLLFEKLKEGILKQGADVIDIGFCSSPVLYFAVGEYDLYDGGVMITASHNSKEYNGFKLIRGNGLPIGGVSGMEEIKKRVLENRWEDLSATAPARHAPLAVAGESRALQAGKPEGKVVETDMLAAYIEKVLKTSDVFEKDVKRPGLPGRPGLDTKIQKTSDVEKFKKFKIVADAGNGMGGISLKRLFEKLPACAGRPVCAGRPIKLIPLYFEPDGNFPNHEANPIKQENLEDLRKTILENKADFGIALDGDGDRIAVIDEKGETARGDYLTAIFAKMMLKKYPNSKILYDVRCSNIVPETIREFGGVPEMTPVGHAPIKKIMADGEAVFGGELSNHYYFRDFYFAESPERCLLLLLKYLTEENKKMSEVVEDLKKYFHTGEINFEVEDKDGIIKKIEERYSQDAEKIYKIDGLRIDFKDWWFNVRPSNTEPLLRLNLEAKTKEMMEEKKREISNFIKNF